MSEKIDECTECEDGWVFGHKGGESLKDPCEECNVSGAFLEPDWDTKIKEAKGF